MLKILLSNWKEHCKRDIPRHCKLKCRLMRVMGHDLHIISVACVLQHISAKIAEELWETLNRKVFIDAFILCNGKEWLELTYPSLCRR